MIWRLLDAVLSRLVGRLLRLSPVDPKPTGYRECRGYGGPCDCCGPQ